MNPSDLKVKTFQRINGKRFPAKKVARFIPRKHVSKSRWDHLYYLWAYASLLPEGATIVEIGTYTGYSAFAMALGVADRGGRVITIDPRFSDPRDIDWGDFDQYDILGRADPDILQKKFRKHGVDNITIIPDLSISFLKRWDGSPIDMLHIDGTHSRDAVLLDCQWMEFVPVGGIVVFDDWFKPVKEGAMHYIDNITDKKFVKVTCSTDQPKKCRWKTVFIREEEKDESLVDNSS